MAASFQNVFQDATVLVTGHTGFKGSWLSIWLKQLGARVVGYSRDPARRSRLRNFALCGLESALVNEWGDIRDAERFAAVLAKHRPAVVFHLAAQPIVLLSYQRPLETFDTNVRGTVTVLDSIRRAPSVKVLVCITSDKVYRDQRWTWGYRENDDLGGHDPYSSSKAMAELAIQSMRDCWSERWIGEGEVRFADHDLVIASTRAGNVIGGGDFSPYRLVPDLFAALLQGRCFVLRSPQAVRPWQHVLEPLSGYLTLAAAALRSGQSCAGAWNFGPDSQENVTCQTLARRLVELWGEGEVQFAQASKEAHETEVLRLDCTKAHRDLGWRPTFDWSETSRQIVNWYRVYAEHRASPERVPTEAGQAEIQRECARQIEHYTQAARDRGACWTCP